jgi:hypothetical protein
MTAASEPQPIAYQDLWPMYPLHQSHPSWLSTWFDDNPFMLNGHWNWQQNPALNKWVVQKLPRWRQHDWDWLSQHKDFWSRSPKVIAFHLQFIGAVFCHQQFSSLILKQDIDTCKALIQEQGYAYCKQQAPFLMSSWPNSWHQNVNISLLESSLFNLGLSIHSAHKGPINSKAVQDRIRCWYPTDWQLTFAPADFLSGQDSVKLSALLDKIDKHREYLCLHL